MNITFIVWCILLIMLVLALAAFAVLIFYDEMIPAERRNKRIEDDAEQMAYLEKWAREHKNSFHRRRKYWK